MAFNKHNQSDRESFRRNFTYDSCDSSFGAEEDSDGVLFRRISNSHDSSFGAEEDSDGVLFRRISNSHDSSFGAEEDSYDSSSFRKKSNPYDSSFSRKSNPYDSSFGAKEDSYNSSSFRKKSNPHDSKQKRTNFAFWIFFSVPIFMILFFFLMIFIMVTDSFDFFTHVSDNAEFDRVAQKLGFEVTHPKVPSGERSVATLDGCTVTFEVSINNVAATKTYFDLGGSDFGGRSISIDNVSSGLIKDYEGSGDFKATKIKSTVLVAETPDYNTCQSKVDKLVKLLGYDEVIREDPMLDEISRRFLMLAYE